MTNPHRGEVSIELGGVSYTARPTYTAIVAYEQDTGRTSTELMMRISSGAFSLREVVSVLHACLAAGGHAMPINTVGEMVVNEGQTLLLKPAVMLLRNALTGGREPEPGESEAQAPAASRSEECA